MTARTSAIPAPIAASADGLHIRGIEARGVMVPLNHTLGTSAAIITEAPLLLVDLLTDGGIVGRTYLFCYQPSGAAAIATILREAVGLVAGRSVAPLEIAAFLERRYALFGVTGAVRMALSALDTALWDALAIAHDRPLAGLLGGEPTPHRAYNSCGLGLMGADAVADEAEVLLERGFGGVKLRLGYATLEQDLAAVRAVRTRVADEIVIPCDYNQALGRDEALRRGDALQNEGLYWLEEPIRHDDYDGYAELAAKIGLPIQIGENFNGPEAMQAAFTADACDLVMPDINRIGGVSGWLRAAELAAAADMPMSSHLMPEVSVHLMAATPTADWIEYVDWADAVLTEPMRIAGGYAHPLTGPGTGIVWDDARIARLRTP
jgi:mandelate racemase